VVVKTFYHGRPVMRSSCTDGPGGKPCKVCSDASTQTRRRWFAARSAAIAQDPTLRPHGDLTTYKVWGCRCDECRHVATEARYKYAFKRTSGRVMYRQTRATPFGREWLNAAGT